MSSVAGLDAPPDMAVERFRRDLDAALDRAFGAGDILAIAVSGGPDSMALLALAQAGRPGRVIAATVDHGLRAAAADEAAMVADYCTGAGIPHATLRPATPIGPANVQASARAARYALLTAWAAGQGATILATAHHADDQAETFLMRAARGSGLSGLAAIRPVQRLGGGVTLVRPLLGWRSADLRAIATHCALPFVDDPSNADDHYDRTRFRALLAATPWLDPAQIARSAAYLAEADRDARAVETWLLETRTLAAPPGDYAIDASGCPREIRRRLLRAGLRIMGAPDTHANVEALLDALEAGKPANQSGILVVPRGQAWHFRAEPPRRNQRRDR